MNTWGGQRERKKMLPDPVQRLTGIALLLYFNFLHCSLFFLHSSRDASLDYK